MSDPSLLPCACSQGKEKDGAERGPNLHREATVQPRGPPSVQARPPRPPRGLWASTWRPITLALQNTATVSRTQPQGFSHGWKGNQLQESLVALRL